MKTKTIVRNKKAWHNYEILEKIEAGIQLLGSEVKSLREGKSSLADSFARIDRGEVILYNMHISPYSHSSSRQEPTRSRKLLLHRREIESLLGKVSKGLALIPLSLYFKRGKAKVELALAKGKKEFDKREAIKKKEAEREIRGRLRH